MKELEGQENMNSVPNIEAKPQIPKKLEESGYYGQILSSEYEGINVQMMKRVVVYILV